MSEMPAPPTVSSGGASRPSAGASPSAPGDIPALTLAADERQQVGAVAGAYADALPDGHAAPYRALAAAAGRGSVPGDLVPVLERVCALSLETGKARDLGRAEGERVLMAVFRRTTRGRSILGAVEDVNRALAALADRRIRSVHATMPLPGRYVLSVETDDLALRLQVGTGGVTIESLATG